MTLEQTNKMLVNLIPNIAKLKPVTKASDRIHKDQLTYGYIQKQYNAEGHAIQEVSFKQFAYHVGQEGYSWKSSLMNGAKNVDFVKAYVLALDFDEGITLEEFRAEAQRLNLVPNFLHTTFSHSEDQHKFRAIWKLPTPVDNPQLKNILQLMLMEVFPKCDQACKDLSRNYNGGKQVLDYKGEKGLDLNNLLMALYQVFVERDELHYTQNIKRFCKKLGLSTLNNSPYIVPSKQLVNETLTEGLEPILWGNFAIVCDKEAYDLSKNKTKKASVKHLKTDKLPTKKVDWNKMSERCGLYNDFMKGKILHHMELSHLAMNLYGCTGFKKQYFNVVEGNTYDNKDNKLYNTLNYYTNRQYAPSRCESKCPYYAECGCPKNILERYYQLEKTVKRLYDTEVLPLSVVEKRLLSDFMTFNELPMDSITFIKAPTGIGKSRLLGEINLYNTLVAVSNHKLGEQLYKDLTANRKNRQLRYAKPLPLEELPKSLLIQIEKLYACGMLQEVKNLIRSEVAKFHDVKAEEVPSYYYKLMEYLDNEKQLEHAMTLLFTHQRISYGCSNENIDTIIFDEDLLRSFVKNGSYRYDTVTAFLYDIVTWGKKSFIGHEDDLKAFIDTIQKALEEIRENNGLWLDNPLKEVTINPEFKKLIRRYITREQDILIENVNLFELLSCEAVKLQGGFLHYADCIGLKQLRGYRIIVLSATLDKTIHTMFANKYLPSYKVNFKDYGSVPVLGHIYCNCSRAWSRQGLLSLTDKSEKALNDILHSRNYNNIITFKDDDLVNLEGTDLTKIAWFGACEGLNGYEGENLCVLGTPHFNNIIYEAYGYLLTGRNITDHNWQVKRVEKFGFEFNLNTYSHKDDLIFTEIQKYLLYSELIQAVGRARGIRFNCDVYVYSTLPLEGCTLI